jgi:signal transduction histidine kinase
MAEDYAVTLAAMRTETEHLSALVDNLLLIARADAEQLPLSMETVDVMEVVDDACRAVRPLAQSKQLTFGWEIGEEMSVRGDVRLLRRAVINLLTNAIKYTMPGGVIAITVASEAESAAISVTDTGIGLAPEEVPHIFERFYRADKSRSGTAGRSGLGLAICKAIVDSHGGTIDVASQPGAGATFSVRLEALAAAIEG